MSGAQLALALCAVEPRSLDEPLPALAPLFADGTLRVVSEEKDRTFGWYPVLRGAPKNLCEGRFVRVMSKPAGGQIRGYLLAGGRLYLWLPDYTADWPEMDAEVARLTGFEVVS